MNQIYGFFKKPFVFKVIVSFLIVGVVSILFTFGQYVGHEDKYHDYDETYSEEPSIISPIKFFLVIELICLTLYFYLDSFTFFKRVFNFQWFLQLLLILSIPLFVIGIFKMNNNYYLFLRYFVCLTSILFIYYKYQNENGTSKLHFAVILLYNPFYLFELGKEWWLFIDSIVGGIFIFNFSLMNLSGENDSKLENIAAEKSQVQFNPYIKLLRSKYNLNELSSFPGDNKMRYEMFSPILSNLYENKVVYHERFIGIVKLENIIITPERLKATAVPYLKIERGNRLDNSFPIKPWDFSAVWSHIVLTDSSISTPYANWQIWCDYETIKLVEELVLNNKIKEALEITLNEKF